MLDYHNPTFLKSLDYLNLNLELEIKIVRKVEFLGFLGVMANNLRVKLHFDKGGLISESFSFGLKCQKKMPNASPELFFLMWIVLRRLIWPFFFENLRQSK